MSCLRVQKIDWSNNCSNITVIRSDQIKDATTDVVRRFHFFYYLHVILFMTTLCNAVLVFACKQLLTSPRSLNHNNNNNVKQFVYLHTAD
jgi:hypothetical protein